jgi:hypothetical protein
LTIGRAANGVSVVPEYGTTAVFPAVLKLPVQVALDLGLGRVYVIHNNQQAIPEGLLTWLKNDLRYRGWFV